MIHGWIENGIRFGVDFFAELGYPSEEDMFDAATFLSEHPNAKFKDYYEQRYADDNID